jgi:hypothetical protein
MPTFRRCAIGIAAIVLALACTPRMAGAGAWTREPGGWFLKLGYDRLFTDERFDETGERVPFVAPQPGFPNESEFRSQALRLYAEYGLTERWTVVGGASLQALETEAPGVLDENAGFSDVTLQLKRLLWAGPVVVSVLGESRLPGGYDVDRAPALGSGAADVGARLAVGASNRALYASAEGGYVVRGGGFADEVPFAIEAGWSFLRELQLHADVRGAMSARAPGEASGTFDPARVDTRRVEGGAGLVLRGDGLDFVFDVRHMLAGENALAGTGFSFAIWWSR